MDKQEQDARLAAHAAEGAAAALAVFDPGGALLWMNARMREEADGLGLTSDKWFNLEQLSAAMGSSAAPLFHVTKTEEATVVTLATLSQNGDRLRAPLDPVTGVLDRRGIQHEIERRFDRADAAPFALVFLDLDDFKAINDQRGHMVGDEYLREVGKRLRGVVRSRDVVGRFGGDEFVVLLDGVSRREELKPVWTRLEAIGADITTDPADPDRPFGVSAGVAFTADGYRDAEELIHAADRQMYLAKRAKRGE